MQLYLMLKIFVRDASLALWIFLSNFVPKFLEQLCKTKKFTKQRFNNKQTVEKEFLYSYHRNLLQFGNVGQELSLLVIKLTTLRRKLIQRFITFENHSFSSSGFLHE